MQLPGERPIFRFLNQSMADGIFVNVRPFRVVAVTGSKLCIPKVDLPPKSRMCLSPSDRGPSFPITDPCGQRRVYNLSRSAEQMDMIWKNDETPNEPGVCFLPHFDQQMVHAVTSQYRFAVPCAYRQIDDVGTVASIDDWEMRRCVTRRKRRITTFINDVIIIQ